MAASASAAASPAVARAPWDAGTLECEVSPTESAETLPPDVDPFVAALAQYICFGSRDFASVHLAFFSPPLLLTLFSFLPLHFFHSAGACVAIRHVVS